MKNPSRFFLQVYYCCKHATITCIAFLTIAAILLSCSKEYSCENNCRLNAPVINDTTKRDSIPPVNYNYYSMSYHVSLAGTGNNAWGFTIPAFDTASGVLDSLEINMSTSLVYYFSLSNNASAPGSYAINIARKDSLSYDSVVLINHDYTFKYGLQNIAGLSTYEDSLSVFSNVQLTSIITDQLDKFTGSNYIAFDYTPLSRADVVGKDYNLQNSFHDSTYILSTYYYKKKIK
jgi:hypothetical protein